MEQQPHYKAEIDFHDLVRNPRTLFGFTYFVFLGVLVLVGILYVQNLTTIGKNSVRAAVAADSTAHATDVPFQAPGVLPPVDVRKISVPTDSLITRGRELYRANCSSCHGGNGLGDGPAGMVMNPRPRNFHQTTGWTNGATISGMYRTLQEGIVRNGMASYSYIPPADRFALIHFVRTFSTAPPADTDQNIMALETTYQLSRGSVLPAQIPVRLATAKVIGDNVPAIERTRRWDRALQTSADPGAALFRTVATRPARVLTGLDAMRRKIGTVDEFVRVVCADPVGLGFKASVVDLSPEQWNLLHHFILQEGA